MPRRFPLFNGFYQHLTVICLGMLACVVGCSSEEEPYRKPTSGVTGQIMVDGTAVPTAEPLKIDCHSVAGVDQKHPTFSSALTGEDGKFQISTYETGDGVPPGEYTLTFMWGKMNIIAASYGGPDRLKKKYSDPKTSEVQFTVKEGEPVDLGVIQLTTD